MDYRISDAERRLSVKAEAQEGVVSLEQAVEAGIPARSVQRQKWLHRVTTAVYAVGHTKVSRRGLLWVAHLATGGAIAGESAAWDYHLIPALTSPIHVTNAGGSEDRPGIKVHRWRATVTERDGLPITTVADALNHLPPHLTMRALREARYLGILQPQALRGRARKGWERINGARLLPATVRAGR